MKQFVTGSAMLVIAGVMVASAQTNAKTDSTALADKPVTVKSRDGKLDGILIRYTPAEIKNKNDFSEATQGALVEVMIRMGQVRPEWGIYDRHPEKGGEFSAVGYGEVVKNATPAVFRRGFWVTGGMFGKEFRFYPNSVYAVRDVKTTDSGMLVDLERCTATTQTVLNTASALVPGVGEIGLEVHYAPPMLSNTSDFLAKGTAIVAIRHLLEDGVVKPEWGIYKSDGEKTVSVLVSEGTPLPNKGGAVYEVSLPGTSEKRTFQSDGKGNLKPVSKPAAK